MGTDNKQSAFTATGVAGALGAPQRWALALTLFFAAAQFLPAFQLFETKAHYLPLHTGLEFVAMAVSVMIFALGWNVQQVRDNSHTVLLSAGFIAVCIIDFSHTLSFDGMPVFVTPSGPEKAINFWLAGRYLEVVVLLGVALLPSRHWRLWPARLIMTGGAAVAVVGCWALLVYQEHLPRTFVPGTGLTPLKTEAEYLLAMLYAVGAILLSMKALRDRAVELHWLAAAAWAQALAELFFTLYSDVTDAFNLLGHIYKSLAYLMVYRAIFVSRVQAPYIELENHRLHLEEQIQQRTADLQAAKIEAERANDAKSRFLAGASHDLRQPLGALILYVEALGRYVQTKGAPILDSVKACLSSLNGLLTDLLDISKFDARVVKPQQTALAINDLLARLISTHSPEAQAKGLALRYVRSKVIGYGDPILYNRMLGNLIANAVRYTERGGVVVGCRRREGKTWVEVWDSGIGIPADKLEFVFEEFAQLGDPSRNIGSGLGLAIVAKIASLLQIQLTVKSTPQRGSVFAVELPTVPANDTARPALRRTREPTDLLIALVEDNASVLKATTAALTEAGHRVVAGGTRAEVMHHLGATPPDVVICDYRLAGKETGLDVIAAIRARYGGLPAIILTGDTDPALIASVAQNDILIQHKPVDLERLQSCIAEVVQGAEAAP